MFLRPLITRALPCAAALALATVTAHAAPLAPLPLVAQGDGGATIVQVRGGCGFGEHRGFYGGCRINHGIRGDIRAATTGLPHGCPPGMRRGFYGRCRY